MKLYLTEEPCLFKYFIYLVKKKSSLDEPSIKESQELWDKLCVDFNIDNDSPRLIKSIEKTNKEIYFDKRVKRLITVKTDDDLVFGEQILAHDILILCFVLNSHKFEKNVDVNFRNVLLSCRYKFCINTFLSNKSSLNIAILSQGFLSGILVYFDIS